MSNIYQGTLAAEMEQWVREDQGGRFDQHPEPEVLAAYHAGSLSPEKDLEIQQHLLLCPECPDLLLDLEDLFEPRHRDLDLSDSWVSAAWRDLQKKLVSTPDSKESIWRRWMRLFSAIPRPAYAVATGLMFFLLVGGTVQISSLRQELARPVGQIADVTLSSPTRGPGDALVEFPVGVNRVHLNLRLSKSATSQQIQAEFWDSEELLWKIPVNPDEGGWAQIEISRWSLEPGEYELRLTGLKREQVYPFQIVHL